MVSGVRVVTLVKGVTVQADRGGTSLFLCYYRWLTIIVDNNDYFTTFYRDAERVKGSEKVVRVRDTAARDNWARINVLSGRNSGRKKCNDSVLASFVVVCLVFNLVVPRDFHHKERKTRHHATSNKARISPNAVIHHHCIVDLHR